MESKFWPELMKGLEQLFEKKENCDIIIQAGEEPSVQEIYAHSIILCCQSTYFRTAFSNLKEKKDGKFIFKKSNISPQNFENILRFIYCGKINLNAENGSDILTLLATANELELHSLVKHIQEFLIDNQEEFIKNNTIKVLENIFQSENFELLRNYCLEIISEKPNVLFESDTFLKLSSQMIEFILKQENLALDEIDVWSNMIKWTHAQHPNINHDPSKLTKDDIEMMKRTTHKLIPLIRFQDISSDDYYNKVFYYEELLSKELRREIMHFYLVSNATEITNLLPSRSSRLRFGQSVIIKYLHFAIFSGWIEKKSDSHYRVRNIPYNFNLLHRASRDGNTIAKFHEKCDDKGATIVIVKIANSEQIVGGYNPLKWDLSNTWKSTNDSFIFSFTDRKDLQSAKVGYSTGNPDSICCCTGYGPVFGSPWNLACDNGNWKNKGGSVSYPKIGIPEGNINVDDYEVFQVVKK